MATSTAARMSRAAWRTSGDSASHTSRRRNANWPRRSTVGRHPFGPIKDKTVKFRLRDVAEALVKLADLHEGLWQVQIMFSNSATNLNLNGNLVPCAITGVAALQLSRVTNEREGDQDELTVDAAQVNPRSHIIAPAGLAVNLCGDV